MTFARYKMLLLFKFHSYRMISSADVDSRAKMLVNGSLGPLDPRLRNEYTEGTTSGDNSFSQGETSAYRI